MKTLIASTLIAIGLLASVGSAVNAADFNPHTFFEDMQRDGV